MTDSTDQAATAPTTLRGRSSAETRSAVLDLIRASGKISRVDLARRSVLTEATISKIVKELLATGLIVHAGYAESTGGKRPVLLRLNDGGRYAVGLTMDFHSSTVVLCGPDGTELARTTAGGTGVDQPELVLDRLAADIERLLEQEGVDRTRGHRPRRRVRRSARLPAGLERRRVVLRRLGAVLGRGRAGAADRARDDPGERRQLRRARRVLGESRSPPRFRHRLHVPRHRRRHRHQRRDLPRGLGQRGGDRAHDRRAGRGALLVRVARLPRDRGQPAGDGRSGAGRSRASRGGGCGRAARRSARCSGG